MKAVLLAILLFVNNGILCVQKNNYAHEETRLWSNKNLNSRYYSQEEESFKHTDNIRDIESPGTLQEVINPFRDTSVVCSFCAHCLVYGGCVIILMLIFGSALAVYSQKRV